MSGFYSVLRAASAKAVGWAGIRLQFGGASDRVASSVRASSSEAERGMYGSEGRVQGEGTSEFM
jgi:hypothetical protein